MCDLLKISGMRDEIFYLKKEIDICKCKLMLLNENVVVKFVAEISIVNKTVMQCLLDEIAVLKDMRLLLLSHLFQEEYKSIQSNTDICENIKQKSIEMIKHLYVPYNMHRENEIRNIFAQLMLKS
jgi:hypothetical protein